MKAVYFDEHGGYDVLKYGDVPDPTAERGEVVIKIHAAACNFNDIWARRGLPRVDIPLPHVSGSDAAGVVVEVGADVVDWKEGDEVITYPVNACRRCEACLRDEEVFCKHMRIWGFQTGPYDGSYAQYGRVQAEQLLAKPAHLSWNAAAATTTSLLSVWRMLVTRAKVQAGDHVLVWGASGGTGSFALLLARSLAATPIAVTSSDEKAEWCRSLGAEHVLIHGRDDIAQRVREITDGRGVDVAFDHVGQETWPTSVESLRWGGAIVTCGATTGHMAQTDLRYLWNKQLTFYGSHIGTRAEWIEAMHLIEDGRITAPVSVAFPLEELRSSQVLMEERGVMGKIAIEVA